MRVPAYPPDEVERLAALHALDLVDTPPEERFDRLTRLASKLFSVPIAYVALVDENRQWFKSQCGLSMSETAREVSFCGHTILQDEPLIINDASANPDFADNPLVTGDPFVRFYAGCSLATPGGHNVGTLCLVDREPRALTEGELTALLDLRALAETELNFVEVVQLQSELVDLKRDLEKRNDLLRKVFGRYMTDEVAETLLADPDRLALGGVAQEVTVLMSDLRGFTPMSEVLSPAEVVQVLNQHLGAMVEIIMKHGGTITSFIGDAILAVFGAPTVQDDDALRAAACAVEMQTAMAPVNQELRRQGLPELGMGIGLNTGEVIVGNIGSDRFTNYSVIGGPVNLAARLESFTVGGQILLSQSTLDQLGEAAEITGRLRVKIKGLEGPVPIFELSGVGAPYNVRL